MKRLLILFYCASTFVVNAQNIDILYPVERTIFQRNLDDNTPTTVWFSGQFYTEHTAEFRIQKLSLESGNTISNESGFAYDNWQNITHLSQYAKTFRQSISIKKGWYRLEIRLKDSNGTPVSNTFNRIFGVGDIFILTGQSNAMGYQFDDPNVIPFFNNNDYFDNNLPDAVNVYNRTSLHDGSDPNIPDAQKNFVITKSGTNRIGFPIEGFSKLLQNTNYIYPSGYRSWCYAVLGKNLINQTNAPVMFFNSGIGSTTVNNWNESADGAPTFNKYVGSKIGGNDGVPYVPFRNTLQMFGSIMGLRSVLWHQGESDSDGFPNGNDFNYYFTDLKKLIKQSNLDFGFPNDNNQPLPWTISNVSFWRSLPLGSGGGIDDKTNPNLINRQNDVINSNSTAFKLGAVTDGISMKSNPNPGQSNDPTRAFGGFNVHFSNYGLKMLADKWSDGGLLNTIPMSGNELQPITNSFANNQITLTAPTSGFQKWYWVRNNEVLPSSNQFTSSSLTITPNTNDIFTCYMTNETNNNRLKFSVGQPFKFVPLIITGIDNFQVSNYDFTIENNATTIEFTLTAQENWTITTQQGWLSSISPTSGSVGVFTITVQIPSNPSSTRFGQILISSPNVSETETIYVKQNDENTFCTYLAELIPTFNYQQAFILQKNKNTNGNTMKMAGVEYYKGIGTHANSTIKYALKGRYTKFRAWIGRDDEQDNCFCGSQLMQMQVKADGVSLFLSNPIGTNLQAQFIDLDVTGKQELELIVNDYDGEIYGDYANWADARLLCDNPCINSLTFISPTNDFTDTQTIPILKAFETINATNTITGNNTRITYQTGQSITLEAGFKVENGAVFETKLMTNPCN